MTRIERRVLTNCVLAGVLLTSIVVLAELLGWLQVPENLMYDLRARHFQFFSKPPTDQLVHLDIDDKAIEGIGRWPWPRSTVASIIDELHAAGAKAIGMDIIFSEVQKPDYEPTADGSGKFVRIDHDAALVSAVNRAGNVLLPASFSLGAVDSDPLYNAALALLTADVERTEREVDDQLRSQFPNDRTLETRLTDTYLKAREEAVYRRVERELSQAPLTTDALRERLIKRRDASINSPLSRLIDEQRVRYVAISRLMKFGVAPPAGGHPLIHSEVNLPVIPLLSSAMASTAFVDFTTSRDGVLRTQPLFVECQGKIFPQMGLSLALLYLGAKPGEVMLGADEATIACPDGRRLVLPVSTIHSESLHHDVSGIFNVPWFGGSQWETMYDWPNHALSKQHLSLNAAWEPVLTRQKMLQNNTRIDAGLATIADALAIVAEEEHLDFSIPPGMAPDDIDTRAAVSKRFLANAAKTVADYEKDSHSKDDPGVQVLMQSVASLKSADRENVLLQQQLVDQRQAMKNTVSGKAVLIGWTATGHQDAVPTSLHASCPGVVTHGAIFNAIVTGHFWRVAPEWITILFAVALGSITAAVAWRFSPLRAFLITSALGIGYVALNGLYFFDHLGQIVGLAAPQIAMAGVWSGCSLARIVIESSERHRITRRFSSYVDPSLVNYVMERTDDAVAGETRELTVCFSDMAGFTSLTERLGEQIVPLLKEFMGRMVPIIRKQGGYIDKFLGDGIMYFFGAPEPNANHAVDAVTTALLMQQAIVPFNDELKAKGLPTVKVRIGINTGLMVVGDAGSDDAADYTVIGDNVNFASRLESANKQLGTLILISARTAELIGDRFLLRPVGALQVVGKTEGVLAYEVCGLAESATPLQQRQCEQTRLMVQHFRGRSFGEAMSLADELEQVFGKSPLTGLYRDLCKIYLADAPAEPFDGKIVFTEK